MCANQTPSDNDMLCGGEGLVIRAPSGRPTAAVLFMHGLGGSVDGVADFFPLVDFADVILPAAHVHPVTVNHRMRMPSWFDVHGLEESSLDKPDGILESVERIHAIVRALPVPSERVVLAGISQGGAVALTAALRSEVPLAGAVALCSWLPLRDEYPSKLGPHARNIPVFMGHGEDDELVKPSFGLMSVQLMQSHGVDITWTTYPGLEHWVSREELDDFKKFLERVVPPQ